MTASISKTEPETEPPDEPPTIVDLLVHTNAKLRTTLCKLDGTGSASTRASLLQRVERLVEDKRKLEASLRPLLDEADVGDELDPIDELDRAIDRRSSTFGRRRPTFGNSGSGYRRCSGPSSSASSRIGRSWFQRTGACSGPSRRWTWRSGIASGADAEKRRAPA